MVKVANKHRQYDNTDIVRPINTTKGVGNRGQFVFDDNYCVSIVIIMLVLAIVILL